VTAFGPKLVAVIVYVFGEPAVTVVTLSVLVIERSALPMIADGSASVQSENDVTPMIVA